MKMTRLQMANFKVSIFNAWGINLFRPDATAPIPAYILRRMGAI